MKITTLDLLLNYLNENREVVFVDKIKSGFDKIHTTELLDLISMLDKLTKDGYVSKKPIMKTISKAGEIINRERKAYYIISFEGILALEEAPFNFNKKPYKWNQIKNNANTIWTVLKIIMIALNAVAIIILTYLQATK